MQESLLRKVANEAHVPLVEPAWVRVRDCDRLLQKIQHVQLREGNELRFKAAAMNEFHWTPQKLQDRMNKLLADGTVEKLDPDEYRLSGWRQFAR